MKKDVERKACKCSCMHKCCVGLLHLVFGAAAIVAFGAVMMWLWNCLVPDIFGFTTITFWQAVGLLVLARLLFGGFCGGGFCGRHKGRHHGHHHHHNAIRAKWLQMTPEERKEFIREHRAYHHHHWFGDCGCTEKSSTEKPSPENTESKGDN